MECVSESGEPRQGWNGCGTSFLFMLTDSRCPSLAQQPSLAPFCSQERSQTLPEASRGLVTDCISTLQPPFPPPPPGPKSGPLGWPLVLPSHSSGLELTSCFSRCEALYPSLSTSPAPLRVLSSANSSPDPHLSPGSATQGSLGL